MEDKEVLKEAPTVEKNYEVQKLKRPGRDKESRMKDLSEEESSADSDVSMPDKEEIPVKSYGIQRGVTKEGKSKTKDSRKTRGRDHSIYKSDKHKKQRRGKDKRQKDSSETSSGSSDDSSSIRKYRKKTKFESMKVMEKEKRTDKHGSSSHNKKDHNRKDSSYSSSSESSDNSSQTSESKREGRLKAKKIKEAIIKRIFAKKKDSIMVSIERKNYESSSKAGDSHDTLVPAKTDSIKSSISAEKKIYSVSDIDNELQKRLSYFNDGSPNSKVLDEDQNSASTAKPSEQRNSPDKSKGKHDSNYLKKQEHVQRVDTSDSIFSSSESENRTPIMIKDHSNKNKTLTDLPVCYEGENKVEKNAIPETEVGLKNAEESRNISKRDSSGKSPTRFNDSLKESNNQSIGEGNEVLKGEFKVQEKGQDSYLKEDNERSNKPANNSSSDSSSDSERSRSKQRGRKAEKTKKKDKSFKRKQSTDKRKGSKKRHGEKKNKKRSSSASSTSSSSSSKSMSDSSSSSGTSSSSTSSSKSSVSKERSSSSSSSTSSSSVRKHKHSFKNKDSVKRRSRSPLNIRKKNTPPRPKKIHVGHLTKNINKQHIYEIFSLYGIVKNVDLPMDRSNGMTPRGFAYVEYDRADDAEKALQHMNGGIIDGQKINVAPVLPFKPRPLPMRRISPNRRPFGGNWRYTPPFRSQGGGLMKMNARYRRRRIRSPPRRRSPRRRTRSRSPIRRRHMRRTSHSSSR